jgi:dTDP-4-dehydrorhamnose reductase
MPAANHTVLITGASGLLGLNMALEAKGTVFGVVNRHALSTDLFQVIHADLLTPGILEGLLDRTQPDWIIHCAALADLDACEEAPELAWRLNAELPGKLARLASRGGARLVHISTDAVFNGESGNYTEEDVPNPRSVYARTKLEGERRVSEANPEALIARVNLFGWSLSGQRSLAEWFFNNLSSGKSVMGFTDVFFCPLLANDLSNLIFEMLASRLSGLYHVVSRTCISKNDFGIALARRFGLDAGLIDPIVVARAGLKASRSPNLTLCTDKLASTLSKPLPDWEKGLERFFQLYQQGYPKQLKQMAMQGYT